MRAMILAAGRGTRMGSLSELQGKPALPVRGAPVIAHLLHWLARNGIRETVVNLHHRPETVEAAARSWCPANLQLHFSRETELLGTGGGIAQAADFLGGDDTALVLSGDMLIDFDLAGLHRRHREKGNRVTLALADDPRAERFGTLGIDEAGRVRRIGTTHEWGGETRRGVFLGVRLYSAEAIAWHVEAVKGGRSGAFEDLRDVLAPRIEANTPGIEAHRFARDAFAWVPVGNIGEYLDANFESVTLGTGEPLGRSLDAEARARGARIEPEWIAGADAEIAEGVRLERVVVWEKEQVAAGTKARDGVFAGGQFHPASGTSGTDRVASDAGGTQSGNES